MYFLTKKASIIRGMLTISLAFSVTWVVSLKLSWSFLDSSYFLYQSIAFIWRLLACFTMQGLRMRNCSRRKWIRMKKISWKSIWILRNSWTIQVESSFKRSRSTISLDCLFVIILGCFWRTYWVAFVAIAVGKRKKSCSDFMRWVKRRLMGRWIWWSLFRTSPSSRSFLRIRWWVLRLFASCNTQPSSWLT